MTIRTTVIRSKENVPDQSIHPSHAQSKTGSRSSWMRSSCAIQLSLLTFLHLLTWSSCSPLSSAPLIATNLNSNRTSQAVVQVPLKEIDAHVGFFSTDSSTADRSSTISESVPQVISNGNRYIKSTQPTSSQISGSLSSLRTSGRTTWSSIAQRQQMAKKENQESTTQRASPTEHSTFLLFCSANSIRYWSASCPVHASANLLIKDRSSSIPHGISSLALWRPSPKTDSSVQLLWYDAEKGTFHRAAIHRKRPLTSSSSCDNLLGVAYNETLTLGNSGNEEEETEARVKLAVDSRRHLLFASRFQNNRLDVFQLDIDDASAELAYLATISTLHPYEVALDETEQVLFWIEDKARICRLEYAHFVTSKSATQNLTSWKHCTGDLVAGLQALTLDTFRQRVLWGDRSGQLYAIDGYYFTNGSRTSGSIISHTSEHALTNLAMSPSSTDELYLSDDQDLYRFRLSTGHSEVVSIESNIQFGLIVLENLPEEETGKETTTMTSSSIQPTENTATNTNNDIFTTASSTSSHSSTTALPPSYTTPASPSPSSQTSVPFIVFTLVPSLVVLLFLFLTLFICCCSHHHPTLAEVQQRLHLNPDSFKARTSAILGRRFTRYAQLRKDRANSTGRDQLIDADQSGHCDIESVDNVLVTSTPQVSSKGCSSEHPSPPVCRSGGDQSPGIINNSFYRSNIMQNQPASTVIEDIEDIFGRGGGQHQHNNRRPSMFLQASPRNSTSGHRSCIACRDSDICADKGICMATYRVY